MGFRNGSYATVWRIMEEGSWFMKVNLSTSQKRKDSDPPEYDTDFSGFVTFYGDAFKKAKETIGLTERSRIKLLDCETKTKYVKDKNQTYTNFNLYDWEPASKLNAEPTPAKVETSAPADDDGNDDELPF